MEISVLNCVWSSLSICGTEFKWRNECKYGYGLWSPSSGVSSKTFQCQLCGEMAFSEHNTCEIIGQSPVCLKDPHMAG
ncbi:hypothetical protein U0070_025313 [Myodes glareolus]|uniref:Uncharacterized protein n=1 Tax=Myodes glareolus TaxID=447135 RepID=A0AAW0JMM5_MYOGA